MLIRKRSIDCWAIGPPALSRLSTQASMDAKGSDRFKRSEPFFNER